FCYLDLDCLLTIVSSCPISFVLAAPAHLTPLSLPDALPISRNSKKLPCPCTPPLQHNNSSRRSSNGHSPPRSLLSRRQLRTTPTSPAPMRDMRSNTPTRSHARPLAVGSRSEEHTSELQS